MPTINVKPDLDEQLQLIANLIEKARKVVVITGAGISTNLGIPDFRSENGLYSLIQEQYNKVNAIQAQKTAEEAISQEAPRKRRKLNRSGSLGADLGNADIELTTSRRSLRSSKSMGFAEDLPSQDDEAPQRSTVGLSGYSTPSVPTFLPQAPTNLLSNVKGKDLFDATIWKDKKSTQTHYTFITSLKHKIDEVPDTSQVHKFIRALRDGGRLLRNYTQNIDMLEKREGLCTDLSRGVGSKGRFNPKLRKESREGQDHEGGKFDNGVEVVQLHGNLEYLRCTLCLQLCEWEEDDRHLTMLSGEAPPCPHCIRKTETRQEKGRRGLSVGTLRPDIVLYGENNPHDAAIGDLSTHDIKIGPDMCIILGTSLKVHGLKLLLREFSKAVHDRGGKVIFVNNTKPSDSIWGDVIDYWVEWDCDAWVRDVKARREAIWAPQGLSPETTPKLQHKQLPGCLPKPQPKVANRRKAQHPVPKNPQCMRIDYFCGAYVMDKIQRILRAQSGRGEDGAETKAIQTRIDQINSQLTRSGKAAEKLALAAAETTLEAIQAARKSRQDQRRAVKRDSGRDTATQLEEEANDKAAAAQLQGGLSAISKLPNMWNTTIQAMRKITCDPAWDSSHLIQPDSCQVHRLLAEQGWTYPSERDAAHVQRLADLVKDNERPAGERAPTRLECQATLFPDGRITENRKPETLSAPLPPSLSGREQSLMPMSSPVSLASDKSNMAHITWNILGNVSQEVGRERAMPQTVAGQRTLFAELGCEFTEIPPPPAPAAAYELRNWSISSPRLSMPAAHNLRAVSSSSASSFGSQDPYGSNRDHIRSVFDLEHSHGILPRLQSMTVLAQPLTGADNATYTVSYMSAASTASTEERDGPLSNAEPQVNIEADILSSPSLESSAAVSPPVPILVSGSVPSVLPSMSVNVPSTPQNNETPSHPIGSQKVAPTPPLRMQGEQDSNASNPPNITPLAATQSIVSGDWNSSQTHAAPSQLVSSQMPTPRLPPNIIGNPNTPQSIMWAPFLQLTGEIYVPPYDITRAARFGMTPIPISFNTKGGQLLTPAPTPPTAADFKEGMAKLQDERDAHRESLNIQGRAWKLLEHRHDELKAMRVAELEYQLPVEGKGQERFPTPPDSDERSQRGSQGGESQQSPQFLLGYLDSQGFPVEEIESGLLAVDESPLAREVEVPMTPKARKMKSGGTIEAIVSSPPPVPPTLSRETEKLLNEYSQLNAKERKELEEYPAVEKRKIAKRTSTATKIKEIVAKKPRQRRKAGSAKA